MCVVCVCVRAVMCVCDDVYAYAMDELLARILAVFPQCDDKVKRGKGKFVAHVSVAKCKNEQQLRIAQDELKAFFRPITFTVKEIYLLHTCVPPMYACACVPVRVRVR
jgi:hypothetical protein